MWVPLLSIFFLLGIVADLSLGGDASTPLDDETRSLWKGIILFDDDDVVVSGEGGRKKTKSVFIAPIVKDLPDCAPGYRADALGRCHRLVRVDHAAQLNFLLQRLDALYASNNDVKKTTTTEGPLHVAIPFSSAPVTPPPPSSSSPSRPEVEIKPEALVEDMDMMVMPAEVQVKDEEDHRSTSVPGAIVTLWHLDGENDTANVNITTPSEEDETSTPINTDETRITNSTPEGTTSLPDNNTSLIDNSTSLTTTSEDTTSQSTSEEETGTPTNNNTSQDEITTTDSNTISEDAYTSTTDPYTFSTDPDNTPSTDPNTTLQEGDIDTSSLASTFYPTEEIPTLEVSYPGGVTSTTETPKTYIPLHPTPAAPTTTNYNYHDHISGVQTSESDLKSENTADKPYFHEPWVEPTYPPSEEPPYPTRVATVDDVMPVAASINNNWSGHRVNWPQQQQYPASHKTSHGSGVGGGTRWSWGPWQTTAKPYFLNFWQTMPEVPDPTIKTRTALHGQPTRLPAIFNGRPTPLYYQELSGQDVSSVVRRPWHHRPPHH